MKMNLMKYMFMIVGVFMIIIVGLNNFERNKEEDANSKNLVKNVFVLGIGLSLGWLIITRLDSGVVDFFGYKIENGLIIYMAIILFVCLLM